MGSRNWFFKMLIIILVLTSAVLSVYCIRTSNIVMKYKTKYNNEYVQTMHIVKNNQTLTEDTNSIKTENEELCKQNNLIKKELETIKKRYKELEEDNLELQKSLKKAASAGVTPQSYKLYDIDNIENTNNKGKYVGKFLGTAYTPSSEECGNNKGITSSGEPIVPGISVAVDNKHWPYGTVFYIKGLGYTMAMDTGSAIKGAKRFDFAVFDKNFAMELGQQYYDVYLVKMGNGKIGESIMF